MRNIEDLQQDVNAALGDVDRLRREYLQSPEVESIERSLLEFKMPLADDLNEFRARVEQLLDRICKLLEEISSSTVSSSLEGSALSLTTLANELNAQLDWLKGILIQIENMLNDTNRTLPEGFAAQVNNPVRSLLQKIISYLSPLKKRLFAKIWQIISNLLTPKEWKLQGKVGTGIFGFVDVGIEITFGP